MNNLKKMRHSRGLSQKGLAEASGVNVRMIQHYEQGVKDINKAQVTTVWLLAETLQCDIRDIMNT